MPRRNKKLKVSDDVKKYVKRAVADYPEKKHYPTYQNSPFAGVVNYDVGAFQSLTTMAQGTTAITRVGDSIRPLSLTMRWRATANNDATGFVATDGGQCSVRYIVYVDKDQLGPVVVVGDILALQPGVSDFLAPYRLDNVPSRFTILYDKMIDLPGKGYAAASASNTVTHYAKIKNLPNKIYYNGALAGHNEIGSLITSNRSNANAAEPYVDMTSSLIYTDS